MLPVEYASYFSGLTIQLLVAVTAFLVSIMIVRRQCQASRMPPGSRRPPCMPSIPILGSLPFMEKDANQMPRFLMEQTSRYGNVFALYLGPRYAIVLNNYESITQALLNKSSQFAERTATLLGSVLNDDLKGIVFTPYNASFRHKRQLYLSILKEFGFGQRMMETRINIEVAEFVRQAKLKDGQSFDPRDIMHTCVVNVIISILVGKRYAYGHPGLIYMVECIRNVLDGIVQELELFPTLQYVPPFRYRLQKYRNMTELFFKVTEKEVTKVIALEHNNCSDMKPRSACLGVVT